MQGMIFYKINIRPDSQSRRLWHRGNSQRSTHLISPSPLFFYSFPPPQPDENCRHYGGAECQRSGGEPCSEVLPAPPGFRAASWRGAVTYFQRFPSLLGSADRHTDRQTVKQARLQTDWKDGQTQKGRQKDWLAGKQAGRLTGRRADRRTLIDRLKIRQVVRQTDRQTGSLTSVMGWEWAGRLLLLSSKTSQECNLFAGAAPLT